VLFVVMQSGFICYQKHDKQTHLHFISNKVMVKVHLVVSENSWIFYKLHPFEYQASGCVCDVSIFQHP
jgi:hypothetical protein